MKQVPHFFLVFLLALLPVSMIGCYGVLPTEFPYGSANCWVLNEVSNTYACSASELQVLSSQWTQIDATNWQYEVESRALTDSPTCIDSRGQSSQVICYDTTPSPPVPKSCVGEALTATYYYTYDCPNDAAPDDRINRHHGDTYAIIYPRRDDAGKPALHIYCVDPAGNGTLDLTVTQEMFDKVPTPPSENTEVASTKCLVPVSLYVLTTGEYQINIGPDIEGKMDIVIFTGLPPANVYYNYFNSTLSKSGSITQSIHEAM
jgi:hypothetical protein